MVTFEDMWKGITSLPSSAIEFVPQELSEETKMQLASLGAERCEKIVSDAIGAIEKGSVEKIETLINRNISPR